LRMPLSISDDGCLVLAMTNPLDVITIDEVSTGEAEGWPA